MTTVDPYVPDPRRWRSLAVTLTAGFMTLLDVSIVNVALPSIQAGLGASVASAQWVIAGYALTFGLVLVAGGRLGDTVGRRRMFLIALSAFVLTSALAGAATSEEMLVGARLLQGVAAGLLTPQNTGLIQELFRGAERGKAFGMFGTTVGLSTAVGPVLGGLIIAAFGAENGWRWVFYVNIPIGIVALVLAARLLPPRKRQRTPIRSQLDFVGMALLGLTVAGVLWPLVQSEQGGLGTLWWLFPIAAVLGILFVRWEYRMVRRNRAPLLDPRLYTQTPGYATGAGIAAIYFSGFTGIWLVFALFFQRGLGYTPLESGLVVTPFALGSAVSAAVAGRLVSKWGRKLTLTGLTMVVLGLGAIALIVPYVPHSAIPFAVAGPLLIAGIGGGLVISPNTTLTLDRVPTRMAGVAGGALQTGQRIGTAIGVAVLASVFQSALLSTDQNYPVALAWAMVCAVALTVAALVLAVLDSRWHPHRRLTESTRSVTDAGPFE
ncbi:drug resistance transporter, EmrB/QacA subfamily [Prauserella marina]|uniref:Drug resistance transporter, EmrB/QacA subfamily n=1 Tax=Prauserella marina TaxID=530584 RepID=A0A1G6MEG0_9PSEU|nr:MFS transporter [Prauserella marina]PWV85480.1 EmrB/QacA subfamily drug resistance transporter [Prauserella marina]SDC53831.1 drug resistance transporter, EmrB/QacA subfamily [Prauserella marina]